MQTSWDDRYALRTHGMTSSVVRELLKLTDAPEIISFAGGLPAADYFPLNRFREAADAILQGHGGGHALQYSATEGERPLRELIVRHTQRYGIAIDTDNVLITSGSQQALDLVGKVFINPGDRVVVERPTYLGALQAWNAYQAKYLPIAVDGDGMRVEQLEAALRGDAKFVYALPNFQNPSGVTLSLARRDALVRLAERHGVPIFEDDPYGQLRYEGAHIPPIVAVDAAHRGSTTRTYTGNVLYSSTFSKILAPGLRLGWIIGPVEVIQRLAQMKQGADLHTGTFVQLLACEVARGGFLDRHIRSLRSVYRARRDRMLAALARSFPSCVTWTRPQGGLFIWVTAPDTFDATDALPEAIADKVAYAPGTAFFSDGGGRNTMRLNFTNVTFEQIDEGIRRLGRLLERRIAVRRPGRESSNAATTIEVDDEHHCAAGSSRKNDHGGVVPGVRRCRQRLLRPGGFFYPLS